MANNVFANGREINCKKGSGKSICAFPDVCWTPPDKVPPTPTGVPVPYPNTGMASDCSKGSKKVKISGKEVLLKNSSHFKKSMGDEAGVAQLKGLMTMKNRGKIYFQMWSMDVKVEGKNAVRHMDIGTHNHGSQVGNSPPWPYIDSAAFDGSGDCKGVAKKIKENCSIENENGEKVLALVYQKSNKDKIDRLKSMEKLCKTNDGKCKEAMSCVVSPFSPNNCCPDGNGDQPTPHHIVPKSQFFEKGFANKSSSEARDNGALLKNDKGVNRYNLSKAPCICVSGNSHSGEGLHARIHSKTNLKTKTKVGVNPDSSIPDGKKWSVAEAEAVGAEAVEEVTDCPKECIQAQVRSGHSTTPNDINAEDDIRPTTAGATDDPAEGNGGGIPD